MLLLSNTGDSSADKPAEPAKTAKAAGYYKPAKKTAPRGFIAPFAGPTGGGAAGVFTF